MAGPSVFFRTAQGGCVPVAAASTTKPSCAIQPLEMQPHAFNFKLSIGCLKNILSKNWSSAENLATAVFSSVQGHRVWVRPSLTAYPQRSLLSLLNLPLPDLNTGPTGHKVVTLHIPWFSWKSPLAAAFDQAQPKVLPHCADLCCIYRLFFLRSIAQFFYTNLHELLSVHR